VLLLIDMIFGVDSRFGQCLSMYLSAESKVINNGLIDPTVQVMIFDILKKNAAYDDYSKNIETS